MNRSEPGRYALVIATAAYRDPKLRPLRAPGIDAKRLGDVLADPAIGGFEVEFALDEEEHRLRRRIAAFFANRRRDDLLLLHCSCHGVKDESGELYLAASDTEMGVLSATGISSQWLNEQIGRSRSSRVVVLLDCCFSGSFPFGAQPRAGEGVDVTERFNGRGRAVITASDSMEYAYEGDQLTGEGRPSIFTSAVVEALKSGEADRDQDHRISVSELYDYVYDRVQRETPNQTPNMLSSLEGPLYIAKSSYEAPVEPAKLDPDLLALAEHPVAAARLGAVEELIKLCESPSKGVALSARLALEQMIGDDSRRVAERVGEGLAKLPQAEREAEPPGRRSPPPQPSGQARPPRRPPPPRPPREPSPSRSRPPRRVRRRAPIAIGAGVVAVGLAAALAILLSGSSGGDEKAAASVPPGDVAFVTQMPDPPGGAVTQAHLQRTVQQLAATNNKSLPTAKASEYEALQKEALEEILDQLWLEGEGSEQGIDVTQAEITKELERIKEQSFSDEAEYQKFLADSGYNQEDVRERVRLQIITRKLQQRFGGSGTASKREQQVFQRYVQAYQDKWQSRTACAPEYVVDQCSNTSKR